ncbi:MAG: nucleotidyltransferase family protein [Bacteroidales bacterium]|nr:nucleotidyltransferase family protein [Bacteroidales bacterium]
MMMNANILNNLNDFFSNQPIEKAWLFGSYAREENTSNSDIDLLVRFSPDAKMTLFKYGGMVYELEQLTGHKVDMVQEKMLKPFAQKSVEQDKILIYERKTT